MTEELLPRSLSAPERPHQKALAAAAPVPSAATKQTKKAASRPKSVLRKIKRERDVSAILATVSQISSPATASSRIAARAQSVPFTTTETPIISVVVSNLLSNDRVTRSRSSRPVNSAHDSRDTPLLQSSLRSSPYHHQEQLPDPKQQKKIPPTSSKSKPNKIAKSQKNPPHPSSSFVRSSRPPNKMVALGKKEVRDDLVAMGVSDDCLKKILAIKESEIDSTGYPTQAGLRNQRYARESAKERFHKKLARRVTDSSKKKKKKKQQQQQQQQQRATTKEEIFPWVESKNWVLFNPMRGWPPIYPEPEDGSEWQKFKVYKPGNKRVVVFNTVSGAVGLGSTPEWMADTEIVYLKQGPRIKR